MTGQKTAEEKRAEREWEENRKLIRAQRQSFGRVKSMGEWRRRIERTRSF